MYIYINVELCYHHSHRSYLLYEQPFRNHSMVAKLQVQISKYMNWSRLLDWIGFGGVSIIILFARFCTSAMIAEADDCLGGGFYYICDCMRVNCHLSGPMLIIFNDFINGNKITLVFILNIVYSLCTDWLSVGVCSVSVLCIAESTARRNAYLSPKHVLVSPAVNFWN